MTKRVMNSKAERVTTRGRPKMGWRKGISDTLRTRGLSMEEGRVKTLDKVAYRKIVNK